MRSKQKATTLKPMRIREAEIIVSYLSDGSLFSNTRIVAILPGCRKAKLLSFSPFYKRVIASSLFGHSKSVELDPEAWKAFLETLPVVACSIFPVEVTPKVRFEAKRSVTRICTCRAITTTDPPASPDFAPVYTPFTVEV